MKILTLMFIVLFVSSCGIIEKIPTPSLPFPVSILLLGETSVKYSREIPEIVTEDHADQSTRKNQTESDREVFFAVSGGGARAAAFTLGVLSELENIGKWTTKQTKKNALMEIDYFSTVSGGGWGAAAYLADRKYSANKNNYSLNENLDNIKNRFKAMESSSSKCLPDKLKSLVTVNNNTLTLGDVLPSKGVTPEIPSLYINSTIHGNQSPFVFTPDYLSYYNVTSFNFCGGKGAKVAANVFNDINVSGPLAVSASVPGFYQGFARTDICDKNGPLWKSFYCQQGHTPPYKNLILVDGGIYDNYGYYTAAEALVNLNSDKERILIIIDSDADTNIPFTQDTGISQLGVLKETALNSGFAARTSAFHKNLSMLSKSQAIEISVIDFISTADFIEVQERTDKDLLEGLEELKNFYQTSVYCYENDGRSTTSGAIKTSNDCLNNNFYRAGILHKTTYKYDEYFFLLREQLGRLAVRVMADDLYIKIYGK